MRSALKPAFFLILVLMNTSCGIYISKNQNKAPKLDLNAILSNPNARVNFSQVNTAIFNTSCIQCHNSAQVKGGVILETYADVKTNIKEVIADIQSGDMPLNGALSLEQLALFNLWIKQGYPEVDTQDAPPPIEEPSPSATPISTPNPEAPLLLPTYQSIRDQIFAPKCLLCHGVNGSQHSDFPLESYEQMITKGDLIVKGNPSKSTVVQEIEKGSMPTRRSGLPKVTPEELQVIKAWILNGAPL